MRKTLGICLLVLFLTSSVSAGEMPNWSPVPPPANTAQVPTTDDTQDANSLTDIALDLLAVLPSLF